MDDLVTIPISPNTVEAPSAMSLGTRRVALCMGSRSEILKLAPVYRALKNTGLDPLVIHTDEQNGLALPLYRSLDMVPDAVAHIRRARPTLGHTTANLVESLDVLIGRLRPGALLVQGDSSRALSAALVGMYNQIPVGHIDAGLRSGLAFDPFPEEQHRQLITRLATWHFAPTQRAVENLVREGIQPAGIHLVGSTGVDAAHWAERQYVSTFTREGDPPALTNMAPLVRRRLLLVSTSRGELRGEVLVQLAATVADLVRRHEDLTVVWPMHPGTEGDGGLRTAFETIAPADRARVLVCEPLTHPQMLWALRRAWLVMTDSAGLQEEAAAFGRPLLVLRNETERPELIESGGAVLAGTVPASVGTWVDRLICDDSLYAAFDYREHPFGDGRAGTYIANLLEEILLPDVVLARKARQTSEPQAVPLTRVDRWPSLAMAA